MSTTTPAATTVPAPTNEELLTELDNLENECKFNSSVEYMMKLRTFHGEFKFAADFKNPTSQNKDDTVRWYDVKFLNHRNVKKYLSFSLVDVRTSGAKPVGGKTSQNQNQNQNQNDKKKKKSSQVSVRLGNQELPRGIESVKFLQLFKADYEKFLKDSYANGTLVDLGNSRITVGTQRTISKKNKANPGKALDEQLDYLVFEFEAKTDNFNSKFLNKSKMQISKSKSGVPKKYPTQEHFTAETVCENIRGGTIADIDITIQPVNTSNMAISSPTVVRAFKYIPGTEYEEEGDDLTPEELAEFMASQKLGGTTNNNNNNNNTNNTNDTNNNNNNGNSCKAEIASDADVAAQFGLDSVPVTHA